MNKAKKAGEKKQGEALKGLTEDEVFAINLENDISKKIEELASNIHAEKFPEDKILTSSESYLACLEDAKQQIYSDINLKRPPDKACVFCNKTLKEVGGKRLIAQQLIGITLKNKKQENNNKDFPRQYFELFSIPLTYMVFWGEKEKWTTSAIESAKSSFMNGKHPWFCQICASKKCSDCDSPINSPMGSDILYGDGRSSHVPILPADLGCTNINCKKYKSLSNE